jgi:PKHD-type hydroxylase
MFFTIENVLSESDLAEVQALVKNATFSDGLKTAPRLKHATKNNLQMDVGEDYLAVVELINRAVDGCEGITNRVFPKQRVNPVINRFDEGMYYREHIDFPIQGQHTQMGRMPGRVGNNLLRTDYSMTLFLTRPEEYDGGELQLDVNDRMEKIKLPAGSAVCYQTGIPHSVACVTRGMRICAIYFFQSFIRDIGVRRTLWDLYRFGRELDCSGHGQIATKADSIRHNLVRYLADI